MDIDESVKPCKTADTSTQAATASLAGSTQQVADGQAPSAPREPHSKKGLVFLVALILVMIIVVTVVTVVFAGEKHESGPDFPPVAMDFTTGVSLVTQYSINATIQSRLARTVLTIEVTNALDCVSIHAITLQLPIDAHVASLKTISDDGCNTTGQVMPLAEARDTFVETFSESLPGAYVETRDSFTYSVQVSMPPLGSATVELVLEELLRQQVGQVNFQLPFAPNEEVDQVMLDLRVLDVSQNTNSNNTVDLDLGPDIDVMASTQFKLDIPNARQYKLPGIVQGSYDPGELPSNGALFTDGACFEHFFNPPNLTAMTRNIVFLMDVSESMGYDNKLYQSKVALKGLIDSMTPRDTFFIQTFSSKGTEESWGYASGSDKKKIEARTWVDKLETKWGGTDLHEAFLEGLLRAKHLADKSGTVTAMMVLSDGWASVGETDRSKIAQDIWKLNQEGKVKIFSLGLENADISLLRAIAVLNGGVTASILPGEVDLSTKMESFFQTELGKIMLSDVQVEISAGSQEEQVLGVTPTSFSVLSQGTEVVVRGLLSGFPEVLRATTSAITSQGKATWIATAKPVPFVPRPGLKNSLCFQSYSHSRIYELLHLRDAAELLGDEVLESVVSLVEPCPDDRALVDCIEDEALKLALEAGVVTKGLTGLVTVDEDNCTVPEDGTEICLDGTSEGGSWYDREFGGGGGGSSAQANSWGNYRTSSGFPFGHQQVRFIFCWIVLVCSWL